mmetsp:Transcript_31146/g.101519  ORF Transcript_31146/g.101519 Transcript_31146/m.101519 type:complete len:187 (-) Transcript_31146:1169-1729(-)
MSELKLVNMASLQAGRSVLSVRAVRSARVRGAPVVGPAASPAVARRPSRVVRCAAEEVELGEAEASAVAKGISRDNPELRESFATIGAGTFECSSCQYEYDPKVGDPEYPVMKGTQFRNLPEDWACPVCGATPNKFFSNAKEVAGFEQNQGYGFGTNTMTGGQKSLLIYGSLAFFFALFIAGYALD